MKPVLFLLPALLAVCPSRAATPETAAKTAEIHAATPTKAHPLMVPKEDAAQRRLWKERAAWYQGLPVDDVVANPAAAEFPGAVAADAARVARDVTVRLDQPRWQSTGLYAAPGAVVTVRVPKGMEARKLSVRIGCHTDNISPRTKWPRFPLISRSFPIDSAEIRVANAFGGLIYIEVPRDKARGGRQIPTYGGYGWIEEKVPNAGEKTVVRITGAVAAPLYVEGVTTAADWRKQLETTGAPWGEIAARHLVISLPVNLLKGVADPAPLCRWWDGVLDELWAYSCYPGQRLIPERIVPDVEISAGFMHSGHPIMCQMVSARELADLTTLQTKGNWGFFHELGHNHECQAWTMDGYVEVAVNIHTLHLMKQVCHLDPGTARKPFADMDAMFRKRIVEKSGDAFAALSVYVGLTQGLGQDCLSKTFAGYIKPGALDGLTGSGTNDRRMDAWVLRFSQANHRNCADYFELFGIHSTPETRKKLASLPVWMPDPGFAKRYQPAAL